MAKRRSYKTAETAAWKAFSRYIRLRDSIRSTGTLEECECFFCRKILPTSAMQAGHVVSRSYRNALFNPEVVFSSCVECNYRREGNHVLGFLHLVEMVGLTRATEIIYRSMEPASLTILDLEDIEEGCKMAAEILEKEYYENTR